MSEDYAEIRALAERKWCSCGGGSTTDHDSWCEWHLSQAVLALLAERDSLREEAVVLRTLAGKRGPFARLEERAEAAERERDSLRERAEQAEASLAERPFIGGASLINERAEAAERVVGELRGQVAQLRCALEAQRDYYRRRWVLHGLRWPMRSSDTYKSAALRKRAEDDAAAIAHAVDVLPDSSVGVVGDGK